MQLAPPVSYTHLDVYKRQQLILALIGVGLHMAHVSDIHHLFDLIALKFQIFFENIAGEIGSQDVYKRQIFNSGIFFSTIFPSFPLKIILKKHANM